MNVATFAGALALVSSHSYPFLFLALLVEGPMVTAAASFASALGVLNIYIVFLLAIVGDLAADFLYYGIGYATRFTLINRYGRYFRLTKTRLRNLERRVREHAGKTMVAIKLTPFIPAPGLIVIGATRMPTKKFAAISFLVTFPKVLLFMGLGYYFGALYGAAEKYLKNAQYLIGIAIVALLLTRYLYGKASRALAGDIDKEISA